MINVSFAGQTYSIPSVAGENAWSTTLTSYLQALASNAATRTIQKQSIRTALTSPVNLTATDYAVVTNLTVAGAVSVVLPAGQTGIVFSVIDGKGDAGTNNVTITCTSGQLINGSASILINENFGAIVVQFDGTGWKVISSFVGDSPQFTSIRISGLSTGILHSDANGNISSSQIVNADVSASAGIDASKIANGSVSSTEFQTLDGVTSGIQAQLDQKTADLNAHLSDGSDAHAGSAISNTPSGNLAATTVQGALNELQTDVDTRATTTSLTSHTGASSGVHGVTGSVVGSTDAQIVTNKRVSSTAAMTGALELPAGTLAQRPTPVTGHVRLNTDSNEFEGYANSAWQSIGGGLNEQPQKNYLKTYANAAINPGNAFTLATPTSNITTASFPFYADGTSGNSVLSLSSSTVLRGSTNYLSVVSGAALAGTSYFQTPAVTLDGSDLGKAVVVAFDISSSLTDGDWDVVVVRYNSAGTYQELISVQGNASAASATPSARLPSGTTSFKGFFIAGSTATDLYSVRFRRLAGTQQIRIDTLFMGPQSLASGAISTADQAYTPTFTGFGTTSNVEIWWRRETTDIVMHGRFTPGTTTAVPGDITLPSGLSFGPTMSTSRQKIGEVTPNGLNVANYHFTLIAVKDATGFNFGEMSTNNGLTAVNASLFASSSPISFELRAPITQWASNVTMFDSSPAQEFAYNTSTSTTTGDSTSFGNGPQGALVQAITATLSRRVRFQTSIQPTDRILVEVSADRLKWVEIGNAFTDGATYSIFPYTKQGGTNYGMGLVNTVNTTDVDVNFGQYSQSNNAAYAGAGAGWPATLYWRVRKISNGTLTGLPLSARNITGDTSGNAVPQGLIGETAQGTQLTSTNYSGTGVYVDVTSVTLTPGKWSISALLWTTLNGSTMTAANVGISSNAGNTSSGLTAGDNFIDIYPSNGSVNSSGIVPSYIVQPTATTTYHLKSAGFYSAGTPQYRGRLTATRIA